MATSPTNFSEQITAFADGVGLAMRNLKIDCLSDIDCGTIGEGTSGTSQAMSTLNTQLDAKIASAQDLLDDLSSYSDLNSRLSAIENIDYTGIYSSGSGS